MNENLKGYYLNKTGDRVIQLLDRQFVVPTLNNIPDEQTNSWQDGEYTVAFRVGELCRVKVNENWEFYQLYDVLDNVYHWRKTNGAGTSNLDDYYTKQEINDIIEQIKPIDLIYIYISEKGEMVLDYSENSIMQDGYINEYGELILEFNM